MAAPSFFFLLGYAHTKTVPLFWVGLGIFLTVLDSWNNDWTWVPPNILLSFAFIRLVRPGVVWLTDAIGWFAFVVICALLFAILPWADPLVDYGSVGWLWAFFVFFQRRYLDMQASTFSEVPPLEEVFSQSFVWLSANLQRLALCVVTAVIYVRQEHVAYAFSDAQFTLVATGITLLCLALIGFRRGRSPIQPPGILVPPIAFIGRHTLEIYALQLGGSELLILTVPELAG